MQAFKQEKRTLNVDQSYLTTAARKRVGDHMPLYVTSGSDSIQNSSKFSRNLYTPRKRRNYIPKEGEIIRMSGTHL